MQQQQQQQQLQQCTDAIISTSTRPKFTKFAGLVELWQKLKTYFCQPWQMSHTAKRGSFGMLKLACMVDIF